MQINIIVNDKKYLKEIDADTTLLQLLREMGCYSVKCGCETSNCGLCTVWLEDKSVLSCSVLAARCQNKKVYTLEGMAQEAQEFAAFMANEGAEQCGFCSPGLIMNVLAMKKDLQDITEENIKHYLEGNLCRCTGYMSHLRALKKYLGVQDESCESRDCEDRC